MPFNPTLYSAFQLPTASPTLWTAGTLPAGPGTGGSFSWYSVSPITVTDLVGPIAANRQEAALSYDVNAVAIAVNQLLANNDQLVNTFLAYDAADAAMATHMPQSVIDYVASVTGTGITQSEVDGTYSVTFDSGPGKVRLVGDQANSTLTPGPNYVYGTDAAGNRGWQPRVDAPVPNTLGFSQITGGAFSTTIPAGVSEVYLWAEGAQGGPGGIGTGSVQASVPYLDFEPGRGGFGGIIYYIVPIPGAVGAAVTGTVGTHGGPAGGGIWGGAGGGGGGATTVVIGSDTFVAGGGGGGGGIDEYGTGGGDQGNHGGAGGLIGTAGANHGSAGTAPAYGSAVNGGTAGVDNSGATPAVQAGSGTITAPVGVPALLMLQGVESGVTDLSGRHLVVEGGAGFPYIASGPNYLGADGRVFIAWFA